MPEPAPNRTADGQPADDTTRKSSQSLLLPALSPSWFIVIMNFLFIILLALLSLFPAPLIQAYDGRVAYVELGISLHDCDNFHYQGDFEVLVPFTCRSLPVLESALTFVKTDEWIHPWDVIFVLVITSTAEGACAGPVLGTLSYDGHCTSYPSGPAAAILVTMGLDLLFNAHRMPPAMKHTVSLQNEIAMPLPIHINLAHQTACTKPLNTHPSSGANNLAFNGLFVSKPPSGLDPIFNAHRMPAAMKHTVSLQSEIYFALPLPIHVYLTRQVACTKIYPSSSANTMDSIHLFNISTSITPAKLLVRNPQTHTHHPVPTTWLLMDSIFYQTTPIQRYGPPTQCSMLDAMTQYIHTKYTHGPWRAQTLSLTHSIPSPLPCHPMLISPHVPPSL